MFFFIHISAFLLKPLRYVYLSFISLKCPQTRLACLLRTLFDNSHVSANQECDETLINCKWLRNIILLLILFNCSIFLTENRKNIQFHL